jgi:anti-sigma factor RsiW
MVTCRELIEFLDDYVADALPAGVRRQFEWHLKLCPACRRYLKTYRRTIDLERRALGDIPAHIPLPVNWARIGVI